MRNTKRPVAATRKALVTALATLTGVLLWVVPGSSGAAAAPTPVAEPAGQAAASLDPIGSCVLPAGGFLSEGPTNWNNFPKPVGPRKAALLFRGSWNIDAEYARLKPAEQLYLTSSFGRYQLTLVPNRRPVSLSSEGIRSLQRHSMADDPARQGDVVTDTTLVSAWGDAARRADPYFDFSDIDIVFLVDSGTGRSYAQFENVTLDGNTIKVGAVLGTDWGGYRHKLLAHEGGHTISLPDLYGGPGGHGYIGGWDLMGNLGGPSPDHFAWHKWKLGWLDDNQMRCVATRNSASDHVLTPVETAGGTKSVIVRYGTSTVYVAEVRTNLGLNTATCDTGVLIYRIDVRVSSGAGPVRVMDSHPSTSCGGNALNDGTYDLGTGEVSTFNDATNQVRFEVRSKANNTYTVRATYGTPPSSDFSMSANPSSGTVARGGSVTTMIGTAVTAGSAQSVTLSASGLPSGVTASFTPTTIQSGQSSTMRLTASGSTPEGTYPITVNGQGSVSGTRATSYRLTVEDGGTELSLSAMPASGSVQPGGSVTSTISASGAAQRVALSASGLPSGASAVFSPSSVTAGESSMMTISTSGSTPAGSYPVMVTGQGSVSGPRTTVFTLTVGQPQPGVVFADDFETAEGWTVNPSGTDTATSGRWERANPETTTYNGVTVQNGVTPGSGYQDLVTGPLAGSDVGAHDLDGGVTSVRSPEISLTGGSSYTLAFAYYLAHLDNASAADYLRVRVVTSGGAVSTVFTRSGSAASVAGVFQTAAVDLSAFAGQTIRLLIEAADMEGGSLLEAAVDDVRVTRQ